MSTEETNGTPGEREAVRQMMRATSLTGIRTEDDLKLRITSYLDHAIEQGHFVRLGTLSRRFSMVASRIGLQVRPVVEDLIGTGEVYALSGPQGQVILTSGRFWYHEFTPLIESQSPEDTARMRDNLIKAAW